MPHLLCIFRACLCHRWKTTHPHKDMCLASYRIQILRKPEHLKLFPAALTCLTADSRGTSGLASERQRQTRRRRWKHSAVVSQLSVEINTSNHPREKKHTTRSAAKQSRLLILLHILHLLSRAVFLLSHSPFTSMPLIQERITGFSHSSSSSPAFFLFGVCFDGRDVVG